MNATKTLMLAAVASFSLGAGAAMVPESPTDFFADLNSQTTSRQAAPLAATRNVSGVRLFVPHSTQIRWDAPIDGDASGS